MPLPPGYVLSVGAVHIWWLCMESQVVLKSIAQWSVDMSRLNICHPLLLRGRVKSVFPYVYAFFFACSFVQMVFWTLFTLGCYPRCSENWWVDAVHRYSNHFHVTVLKMLFVPIRLKYNFWKYFPKWIVNVCYIFICN